MSAERPERDRNEAAGLVVNETVRADRLERDATIVPREAYELDMVLGSDACPTCYRVTSVRNTGKKVFVETVRAHFEVSGKRRKTFIFDPAAEVSTIPPKAYRSLREKRANERGLN